MKNPRMRGKTHPSALPTIGEATMSRIPSMMLSMTAWPAAGTSFGLPTARRIRMTKPIATSQLITMLFVTGNGPTWNRESAMGETPAPSAAKAGAPEARAAETGVAF